MTEGSSTRDQGAGLVRGRFTSTATTAEPSGKFQPTLTYQNIIKDREQRAQARAPLGQRLTLQLLLRRRQLVRFAVLCREEGRRLDESKWLLSLAWAVKALGGWGIVQFKGMKEPQKRWHPVLSRTELRRWTNKAGLRHITEAQLQQAEIAVCRAPRQALPDALQGAVLRITAAERDRSRFWTAGAIDETREQRRQRKRIEKLERDRKAKAARDEAARQSGKRKTRDQYRADWAARREREAAFCRQHGIATRTLRLWKKKAANGNPQCQSLVADIERSSTSRENPVLERPHFGNVGCGRCPQNRVFEPEPAVQLTDPALAWPVGHRGAADGRSSRLEVALCAGAAMPAANPVPKSHGLPGSMVRAGSGKDPIRITSPLDPSRDIWPHTSHERRCPLTPQERLQRAEHHRTGYLMRKQRQASRQLCA